MTRVRLLMHYNSLPMILENILIAKLPEAYAPFSPIVDVMPVIPTLILDMAENFLTEHLCDSNISALILMCLDRKHHCNSTTTHNIVQLFVKLMN
jgi:hypothetical protein